MEWISVEERLPEPDPDKEYLVWFNDQWYRICAYDALLEEKFWVSRDFLKVDGATHWAEIKPPKGGK